MNHVGKVVVAVVLTVVLALAYYRANEQPGVFEFPPAEVGKIEQGSLFVPDDKPGRIISDKSVPVPERSEYERTKIP